MTGLSQGLSQQDVELLAADPNPATRAQTMLRVAETYGHRTLSGTEREIALGIIDIILPEVEVGIRVALAEALRNSPHLDHGLARRLAIDVLEVASPILANSLALNDDDLVEVIGRCGVGHARAVALRPTHTVAVTDALIRTDDETVIQRLAANDNSRISTGGFHQILNRFGDNGQIMETVSARQALPHAIVERLTALVTGRTLERLIGRYAVPAHRVAMILHHAREHFLLQSVASESAEELRGFALRLLENRLLGPSLIVRALAIGQFNFLLQALSVKARLPVANVRRLISDDSARGQGEIYDHCGFDRSYRVLFSRLLFEARQHKVNRDGAAPDGWIEQALPILKHGLQSFDPEWTLEQLVTEALIEIEETRDGNNGNPSRYATGTGSRR